MKTIEPCTIVILGAGGDLARRKLIPALFRLELFNRLPENMAILGCGRKPMSDEQWSLEVLEMLKEKQTPEIIEQAFSRFRARLHYHANPPDDAESYQRLQKT